MKTKELISWLTAKDPTGEYLIEVYEDSNGANNLSLMGQVPDGRLIYVATIDCDTGEDKSA